MHVTIIMAAHNDGRTVGDAIASVVAQTHVDWDLAVVDDASDDGTADVLNEWAARDRRITVLQNRENRGLAYSLNRAWQQASGPLVARLDGDDRCLPTRLARQVLAMTENPDIAVLGTGVERIDEHGRALGNAMRPARHEALVATIYKENPFIHPTVMMRLDFLMAIGGYDETLRRAQDYDLWLRSYRRFRFANLQEPLVQYRVRRRPPLSAIVWGTYVLGRSACREGRFLTDGPYALRFFAASLLTKIGARNSGLR